MDSKISSLIVKDVRFPTSLEADGSDAMVKDPDYSCAYVMLRTDDGREGCGHTFTIGRGTDIVCYAIKVYRSLIVGRRLGDIFKDPVAFFQELTQEPQLRWLGPEKGVTHLATSAIVNAFWDLCAKMSEKPLWKLLVDMPPEDLVDSLDFRYISDALTKQEALDILTKGVIGKEEREKEILLNGFPAYTMGAAWMGYDDEKVKQSVGKALDDGYTRFKVKVGVNLEDDKRRLGLIRSLVGDECLMMADANQRWDVDEAIAWMKELAPYKLLWIEEPTSPDDIAGHARIAKALNPLGIGVATGEHCQNRVMFKQFLSERALQFCQIDGCRLAGPTDIIPVYLMAKKYGVPVCPHGGGVGLTEVAQHLSIFDYIAVSGSFHNRMIEYADHTHEHFIDPVVVKRGHIQAPRVPGYSSELHTGSVEAYEYPNGSAWQELFREGKFVRPTPLD